MSVSTSPTENAVRAPDRAGPSEFAVLQRARQAVDHRDAHQRDRRGHNRREEERPRRTDRTPVALPQPDERDGRQCEQLEPDDQGDEIRGTDDHQATGRRRAQQELELSRRHRVLGVQHRRREDDQDRADQDDAVEAERQPGAPEVEHQGGHGPGQHRHPAQRERPFRGQQVDDQRQQCSAAQDDGRPEDVPADRDHPSPVHGAYPIGGNRPVMRRREDAEHEDRHQQGDHDERLTRPEVAVEIEAGRDTLQQGPGEPGDVSRREDDAARSRSP